MIVCAVQQNDQFMYRSEPLIARSALSIRQWWKTDVRPSSFFFDLVIDFCERHLEGASLKILSVIWAIDFAWSENWMAVNRVSDWDRPVRGPFFGRKKVTFLEKSCKKWSVTFTFGKGCKNHTVSNWRWWRHGSKLASNESIFVQPTRASRPCRARCI